MSPHENILQGMPDVPRQALLALKFEEVISLLAGGLPTVCTVQTQYSYLAFCQFCCCS